MPWRTCRRRRTSRRWSLPPASGWSACTGWAATGPPARPRRRSLCWVSATSASAPSSRASPPSPTCCADRGRAAQPGSRPQLLRVDQHPTRCPWRVTAPVVCLTDIVAANAGRGVRGGRELSPMPVLVALGSFATTLLGGVAALRIGDRRHLVLGLAAGLMLGVVLFDLLPEALSEQPEHLFGVPVVMLAAMAGFLALHVIERSAPVHRG